jgi:hypothetical protein
MASRPTVPLHRHCRVQAPEDLYPLEPVRQATAVLRLDPTSECYYRERPPPNVIPSIAAR